MSCVEVLSNSLTHCRLSCLMMNQQVALIRKNPLFFLFYSSQVRALPGKHVHSIALVFRDADPAVKICKWPSRLNDSFPSIINFSLFFAAQLSPQRLVWWRRLFLGETSRIHWDQQRWVEGSAEQSLVTRDKRLARYLRGKRVYNQAPTHEYPRIIAAVVHWNTQWMASNVACWLPSFTNVMFHFLPKTTSAKVHLHAVLALYVFAVSESDILK